MKIEGIIQFRQRQQINRPIKTSNSHLTLTITNYERNYDPYG